MPAELQTSRHHATLVLTLNGTNPLSLLQADMHAAVIETLSTAESDRSVAAVVLNGLEGFSPAQGRTSSAAPLPEPLIEHLNDWVDAIQSFPKPVLAAVDGQIDGPGLSLMLACDLIVASRSSMMGASPAPGGGASWFLAHGLPRQLAMEMLTAADHVPAARLHALGLINRLSDEGAALELALKWTEELASDASRAEGIKTLLKESLHNSLTQQLAAEAKYRLES